MNELHVKYYKHLSIKHSWSSEETVSQTLCRKCQFSAKSFILMSICAGKRQIRNILQLQRQTNSRKTTSDKFYAALTYPLNWRAVQRKHVADETDKMIFKGTMTKWPVEKLLERNETHSSKRKTQRNTKCFFVKGLSFNYEINSFSKCWVTALVQ